MRWKIASRFLLSTIIIVIIILVVNTIIGISLIWYQATQEQFKNTPEQFTRQLAKEISGSNETISLSPAGKKRLDERNAWLQVLDDNGNEIYRYRVAKEFPKHYSPNALINNYKNRIVADTTLYISETKKGQSYFVGIKNSNVQRSVFTFDIQTAALIIGRYLLIFLFVDILIALLIGVFFGQKLTKPLHQLIEGISTLRKRNFTQMPVKSSVYKEVFDNMNELSNTLDMYEKAQQQHEKMRDEWISNISHDLKTPLASIQGYAELLEYANTPEEVAEYSQIITQKSHYMKELLDDLNLTMKLRNNALPLQLKETNLVSFSREIIIDVLNDEAFVARSLDYQVADDVIMTTIDQKLIKRALLNFIDNAFIHNDEAVNVTVSVSKSYPQEILDEEKLSTMRACIMIQDTGKGIPEDELNNIFERYYRGTNTTNTRGTGLGTAIARDIVEAHGGRVVLRSERGKGTTIFVLLP